MKEIGMEKAFVVFALVLITISGVYYLTLPEEEPILREEGWNTDKSVLRSGTSSELVDAYVLDNETRGRYLVERSLKYNISRVAEENRLSDLINTLKSAAPEENKTQANEYYNTYLNKSLFSETSYFFAVSNFHNVTLVKEDREVVPGGTVPIVRNKTETKINAFVLMHKSMNGDNGSWELVGIAHSENGEYITPKYVYDRII